MSKVDLNGKKDEKVEKKEGKTEKQKLIYMNIPTALMFIMDNYECPNAGKYIGAISKSISSTIEPDELRDIIYTTFGRRSEKHMKEYNPKEYEILTDYFGKMLWSEED